MEQLIQRDIPFTVEGIDLLETAEVRDLLAALRAIEGGDPVGLLAYVRASEIQRRWQGDPGGASSGRKKRPILRPRSTKLRAGLK